MTNWQATHDGLGVVIHRARFIKIFDYRRAPTVGQHLCWAIYGPFGRMRQSGFATTLRQAKTESLKAEKLIAAA